MTPEDIARKLTAAQRRAVRRLHGEWQPAKTCALFFGHKTPITERRYHRIFGCYRAEYRLTPLGLAVRNHLLQKEGD